MMMHRVHNVVGQPCRVQGHRCPLAAHRVPCVHVENVSAVSCRASTQHEGGHQEQHSSQSRRDIMLGAATALVLPWASPSQAALFDPAPAGYRRHVDKLDGYTFVFPDSWIPVTTSGNDVFYRNPYNLDENLFVNITSPSSSKYSSVQDLGNPGAAAIKVKTQFLEEFMSTRLGVRREADVVSATERTGADGKLYYDIEVRVKSYASRNQLAVTQAEVQAGVELEWDRRFLTVLGVAGKRLYELRLQTAEATYAKDSSSLERIVESFRCYEVV